MVAAVALAEDPPVEVGPAAAAVFLEEVPVTAGKSLTLNTIPNWLSKYISEDGLKQVSGAVQKAEALTCAEIVPMVVRRSSPKGHVRQSVFLLLMVLGLIFLKLESLAFIEDLPGGMYSEIALVALLAFLIAIPLAKLDFFISKFVSLNDQKHSVHLRAEHEFYAHHFDKTEGHSAVLIFISMMERRVVVLADSGIADKADPNRTQEVWKDLSSMITASLKQGNLNQGLTQAIEKAGGILAEHLPASAAQNKNNEISNDLRILE
jgi:putative membrane protein